MLLAPSNPDHLRLFLERSRQHLPPIPPVSAQLTTAPLTDAQRLERARLIARETCATRADLDNAHNTASFYRRGVYDETSEMRIAMLAAYLALST